MHLRARIGSVVLVLMIGLLTACASGPPPTPTELGEQALAQGDWRGAQTQFGLALEQDPANGRAWQGQARAQLAGRDPEAALRSLGELAKVERARFSGEARPVYADALAAATEVRLARGQAEPALAAARALAKLEPSRRGLDRLLGGALLADAERRRLLGERKAALALFEEACHVVPGRLEAWIAATEILLEMRKGKRAIRLLEAARKAHPTAREIKLLTRQALASR